MGGGREGGVPIKLLNGLPEARGPGEPSHSIKKKKMMKIREMGKKTGQEGKEGRKHSSSTTSFRKVVGEKIQTAKKKKGPGLEQGGGKYRREGVGGGHTFCGVHSAAGLGLKERER